MKELSIEEKAKRYDEALKWMENVYPTLSHEQQMEAEVFFPIFKESEDERIRKDLIIYLRSILSNKKYGDKFIEGWIAWLEKQKPIQNINKEDEEVRQYIVRIMKQRDINVPMVQKSLNWLEKQVPVDREKVLIGARKDVALSIINYLDNNSVGMCLSNMECEDIEDACVNSKWTKLYNYMKKKLEKQGEQKPAWSEEDKEMLEDTCRILSNSKECTTSNVRWLKSLRPQNTWKPSGFHLECISDAIAMYQERGINAIGLKEILEELKKLKEE